MTDPTGWRAAGDSGPSRRGGQLDDHAEAGPGVLGADPAVVEVDGPPGDRQAEADPAADPAPVGFDPEEGLEDPRQGVVGDAGPSSLTAIVAESGPPRSSRSMAVPSGAWRIALRATFSTARRSSSRSPTTGAVAIQGHATRRQPLAVGLQVPQSATRSLEQLVKPDKFDHPGVGVALGGGELEQLAD